MSESKHTPGPWRWEINLKSKSLHLVGGRPMFDLTVMDFERWGMGGATVRLRDLSEDGMNIMHKVNERPDWIAPFEGRGRHADWCADITHPDMQLIASAPDLAAEVERLKARADEQGRNACELFDALKAAQVNLAERDVEVERLREENDKLRAKLGNSPEPCAYCGIPADKLLECRHGFPGCPRADDMMLCGHFGAAMEAAEVREALAAERRKVEALEQQNAVLREYFNAQRCLINTLGHEDATAQDEERAEARAIKAAAAVQALDRAALAATEGGE